MTKYVCFISCYSSYNNAEPHSSMVGVQDLRTGVRWFDPRFGQYSATALNLDLSRVYLIRVTTKCFVCFILFAHLSTECSVSYCDHSRVRLSDVRPSTIFLLTLYKYLQINTKLGQIVFHHKILDEFDYGCILTRTVRVICP